jgi:hypothetical protein
MSYHLSPVFVSLVSPHCRRNRHGSRLFGNAIGYGRVRIHSRRYMPFQPKNCATTPNGSMYFYASRFLDDYSCAGSGCQRTGSCTDGELVAVCTLRFQTNRIVLRHCCMMREWTRKSKIAGWKSITA